MGERKRSMLRIAVCDDEIIYIDNISDLVKKYSEKKSVEIDVYQFERSFDLLDRIEEGELYDAFLLDIYMPGISGISVAEELREKHINAPVIFLTSSPDHAIEAFEVSATHYILKPISEEKFFSAMDKAISNVPKKSKDEILLKTERVYRSVFVNDIIYVETDGNYQRVFLSNGEEIRVRMTSAELFNLLCNWDRFYKCGRAYIVNLGKINKLTNKTVVVKGGNELQIPRNVMIDLKEAYFKFFDRHK